MNGEITLLLFICGLVVFAILSVFIIVTFLIYHSNKQKSQIAVNTKKEEPLTVCEICGTKFTGDVCPECHSKR